MRCLHSGTIQVQIFSRHQRLIQYFIYADQPVVPETGPVGGFVFRPSLPEGGGASEHDP